MSSVEVNATKLEPPPNRILLSKGENFHAINHNRLDKSGGSRRKRHARRRQQKPPKTDKQETKPKQPIANKQPPLMNTEGRLRRKPKRDYNGRRYEDIPLDEKERIMAEKEVERTAVLWRSLKLQGYELYGFFHTSTWQPFWREVLTEQLLLLDGRRSFPTKENLAKNLTHYVLYEQDNKKYYTSLLGMSDGMHLNVAVKSVEEFHDVKNFVQTLNLRYHYKILFHYNFTLYREDFVEDYRDLEMKCGRDREISCGEVSTYQALRGFCRNFVRESDMDNYGITDPEERRRFPLQEETIGIQYNGKYGHHMPADIFKKKIPGWEEERNADYKLALAEHNAKFPNEEVPVGNGRYGTGFSEYPRDNKRRALIFYFHLKGSSALKDPKDLSKRAEPTMWRQYMGAFNLEFPSICMRAIGDYGYSVCGTEYRPFLEHFSGNFWWTDCEHLSQLRPLKYRFDCFEPEYNSVRVSLDRPHYLAYGGHCVYNMFYANLTEGLAFEELPRSTYFRKLWELVINDELIDPNITAIKPTDDGKNIICSHGNE